MSLCFRSGSVGLKKKEWGGDRKGFPRCADSECPSDDCVCQGGPGHISDNLPCEIFKFPFFRPPTPNRSARDIWNRTITRSFQYYFISQIFFYITYRSTFWYTLSYIEPQFFVTIKQNAGSTDTCIILY